MNEISPPEEDLASQISSLRLSVPSQSECHSPILTLPPEIVAEIFIHFLPSYPERTPLAGPGSPLFLSLSKACPLSLSIMDSFRELLDLAVKHCERWEEVEIVMYSHHLHHLPQILGDTPLLRRLKFGPSNLPMDDGPELILFDRAPRLRDVVLTDCFLSSVMRLPWAQLTHLEALCLYEHECTEILSETTRLVYCTITVCSSTQPYLRLAEPAALPDLRTLVLFVTDSDDVELSKVLDNIAVPALRKLRVCEPCLTRDPVGALKAFFARSRCELEELRVDEPRLEETQYREAFPAIKSIRFI
ncbi:hypothetical protein C8R43DRAFT_1007390 [Mycena crocata]|nr:hypothetical protein C8R43DRAFT_1007390 [Mycena crocata]